jgi:hypothetical protein
MGEAFARPAVLPAYVEILEVACLRQAWGVRPRMTSYNKITSLRGSTATFKGKSY